MNKTFTAAIALTAIAGFAAAATIETPAAGYIDKDAAGGQILVSNPFNSFTTNVTTLADIDGSYLGNGNCIALVSANGHLTKLYWQGSATPPGWYDAQSGGTCYNTEELARGDGILFNGASEKPLVFAGPLAEGEETISKAAINGGYKVVGNASPVDTKLSAFSIGGTGYDYAKDYVTLRNVKYVYKNNNWYYRENGESANNVDVYAGEGLFLYCQRRRGGTFSPTIIVPANY